jgi:hypothetical protein
MFHHLPHEQPTHEGFLQVLDMLQQEKEKESITYKGMYALDSRKMQSSNS